jgi:hypothetical protein
MIKKILEGIDLDTLIKEYNNDYELIIDTIDKQIDFLTDTIDNFTIQSKMIKDKMISDRDILRGQRIDINRHRQYRDLDIKD